MRKLILLFILAAFVFGGSSLSKAASGGADSQSTRVQESYVDMGSQYWQQLILNSTTTIAQILIPKTVKGVKMYSRTNTLQFSVGTSTTSGQGMLGTLNSGTAYSTMLTTASFQTGGVAKPDQWETRLLPSGTNRKLMLMPLTAGTTVDLELF